MIDEALPRFTFADTDSAKTAIYLSRPHENPEPSYTLIKNSDPSNPASRNCYAAGLQDAYNPDILFGEVLISPKWTQPTLSAEDIRRNGGLAPPPEPLMPSEFTIQLYNPEQQIPVSSKTGQLLGTTRFEFGMPVDTFRQPSSSLLDRGSNDPAADATVLKINFSWKRENMLTKDLVCYMTGKSTDVITKKKNKEPDIAIAHFKGLKDLTIYEPNLYRVDLEDPKGFEVVLVLGAAIIRDVFFSKDLRAVFSISQLDARRDSVGGAHSPASPGNIMPGALNAAPAAVGGRPPVTPGPGRPHAATGPGRASNSPPAPQLPKRHTQPNAGQPITDPRTQWELDNETARIRTATAAEERARQKGEERARREREKATEEETRRLRKMVEREEKERQQKQKEIDKETERLKKLYGTQSQRPQSTSGFRPSGANMMSGAVGVQPSSAPPPQTTFQQAPNTQSWYGGYTAPPPMQPPRPATQQSFVPSPGYQPQFIPNQGYQQHFGNPPRGPYLQLPNTQAHASSQSLGSNTTSSSGGWGRRRAS